MAVLQKLYMQSELRLQQTLGFFKGIICIPAEMQISVKDVTAPPQSDDNDSDDEVFDDEYCDI